MVFRFAMGSYIRFNNKHLGSIEFSPQDFPEGVYKELETGAFASLSIFDKHDRVSRVLCEEIRKTEGEVFLLPQVVSFINRARKGIHNYNLASFEFWLNQYSGLEVGERRKVRAKIVGKNIPRGEYQKFFPVGGDVVHPGSHYSCAHYSPDVDTTVASFLCFLCAFGAEVGTGRHHWMLPGGPPKGSIEIDLAFHRALGGSVFSILASTSQKLSLSSLDLLTQKNISKKTLNELSYDIDQDGKPRAVILVNDEGCYAGDWRTRDADSVRALIARFVAMLNEFQNHFQMGLISLFAKKDLTRESVKEFINATLERRFSESQVTRELNEEHRLNLDRFFKKVLHVEKGYGCSFKEFIKSQDPKYQFVKLEECLKAFSDKELYAQAGTVDREYIFKELEKVLYVKKEVFNRFLRYIDSLDVALQIKQKVLGHDPHFLSHLAEYDEILSEIGDYTFMTVNYQDGEKLYPLGVIHGHDLYHQTLATSSWMDFSNPSETDTRPYVEVISFIDHHKSMLQTVRPASGIVLDVQSSNSIIASYLMEMNDKYSSGGMSMQEIEAGIVEVSKELDSPSHIRILQRLLQKKKIMGRKREYYISTEREVLEYVQCLFAILDDTDLLTKVTEFDVDTVRNLINHLRSLMLKKEVEVVNFDDIDRHHPKFVKKAAKKLLQTSDLYSFYSVIYKTKEEATENVIKDTAKGLETTFFQDTKIMGEGFSSVGQLKHFVNNGAILAKKAPDIRNIWLKRCQEIYQSNPDIRLHIFMLSTISSAEELFSDSMDLPTYKDEIWIWIPVGDRKAEHQLRSFLKNFYQSSKLREQEIEVLIGGKDHALEKILSESVQRPYNKKFIKTDLPMISLLVEQKKVVSRKSDIASCL